MLISDAVDDHVRTARRQCSDRRADHDRRCHAHRHADSNRIDVPAVVVMIVIVMMVVIVVVAVVVVTVVVVAFVVVAIVVVTVVAAAVVVIASAVVVVTASAVVVIASATVVATTTPAVVVMASATMAFTYAVLHAATRTAALRHAAAVKPSAAIETAPRRRMDTGARAAAKAECIRAHGCREENAGNAGNAGNCNLSGAKHHSLPSNGVRTAGLSSIAFAFAAGRKVKVDAGNSGLIFQ